MTSNRGKENMTITADPSTKGAIEQGKETVPHKNRQKAEELLAAGKGLASKPEIRQKTEPHQRGRWGCWVLFLGRRPGRITG